eukprot:CAMPEP_0119028686 /NCGR_PEP_ID=MMETSP1176-20130426/39340_1 /TAXON_ID=265551 /ORGANISM="Synedropsis recta cf, Strain CCMP1620" /LENGTH=370 /DNA_ID=CAMNT_0006984879 /DNA_START=14 /DNA_END=1123 /DNA_ORIENTATION=+
MTKYLDEKQVDSMDQLEAAMAMLLASQQQQTSSSNNSGNSGNNQKQLQKATTKTKPVKKPKKAGNSNGERMAARPATTNSSFVCIMCQKGGFANPQELGAHVAFCNGGIISKEEEDAALPVVAVEEENTSNTNNAGGFDIMAHLIKEDAGAPMFEDYDVSSEPNAVLTLEEATATFEDYDISSNAAGGIDETEFDDYDVSDEEEDDDDDDDIEDQDSPTTDKWDGESPFDMTPAADDDDAAALAEPVTTKAQDELLDQYQSMHDDEKIDDSLLLEVLHLIVASSYGDGAVLVFFPGWGEISEFSMLLENTPPFRNRNKYIILPLHSGIPSKEQRKVFQRPPKGVRKIILSTNIAETSVTIDDVSFVVDTG